MSESKRKSSLILENDTRPMPVEAAPPDEFPESGGPCEDCAHSVGDPEGKDPMLQCREGPAQVQIFLLPPPGAMQRPVTYPISTWPTVRRRQGCAKFLQKKALQS